MKVQQRLNSLKVSTITIAAKERKLVINAKRSETVSQSDRKEEADWCRQRIIKPLPPTPDHYRVERKRRKKEGKLKKWNALCYCALVSQSIKSPLGDVCTMKELLNSELTAVEKKLNGQWWRTRREKHTSFQSLGSPLQEKIRWTNAWSFNSVIRATANWFSSSSSSKLTWSMLKACQCVGVCVCVWWPCQQKQGQWPCASVPSTTTKNLKTVEPLFSSEQETLESSELWLRRIKAVTVNGRKKRRRKWERRCGKEEHNRVGN